MHATASTSSDRHFKKPEYGWSDWQNSLARLFLHSLNLNQFIYPWHSVLRLGVRKPLTACFCACKISVNNSKIAALPNSFVSVDKTFQMHITQIIPKPAYFCSYFFQLKIWPIVSVNSLHWFLYVFFTFWTVINLILPQAKQFI